MRISDLNAIYSQCGATLHRGKFGHTFMDVPKTYDLNKLEFWRDGFVALLSYHIILLLAEDRLMIVNLFGGPKGEVAVYDAAADQPGSIYLPT